MSKQVVLARYTADGVVRSLWDDRRRPAEHGMRPVRASRVEVVEEGPFAGCFYTTILLAAVTGDPSHEVSLWPPLPSYEESVQRERRWLAIHYILGG